MHLGAFFFGVGHHLAAWRHPDVDPAAAGRIESLKEWTRIAEAAKFDAIFFADNVGLPGPPDEVVARNALWYPLDPLISLTALSQSTTHIGLVATVSSTYLPPYHLARKYASLDQVSGCRRTVARPTSSRSCPASRLSSGARGRRHRTSSTSCRA